MATTQAEVNIKIDIDILTEATIEVEVTIDHIVQDGDIDLLTKRSI